MCRPPLARSSPVACRTRLSRDGKCDLRDDPTSQGAGAGPFLDERHAGRARSQTLAAMKGETRSPAFQRVMGTIRRAAQSDAPVFLRGETGSGKTLFAEVLHNESQRCANPFIVINCPTLSDGGLTNDSFVPSSGPSGGTLFLDDIGELPASFQTRLLRFVHDNRELRIVAATSRNIDDDIAAGRFRQDLFFRLNVVEIDIPSIRERPEDILPLARHFIELFAAQGGSPVPELSASAAELLCSYFWPGNVRELKNTIERAVILSPSLVIEPAALPDRLTGKHLTRPFIGGDYAIEQIEQEHILRVINRTPTLEKAASILGIDYTTLWRKRKRYLSGLAAQEKGAPHGDVSL